MNNKSDLPPLFFRSGYSPVCNMLEDSPLYNMYIYRYTYIYIYIYIYTDVIRLLSKWLITVVFTAFAVLTKAHKLISPPTVYTVTRTRSTWGHKIKLVCAPRSSLTCHTAGTD